MPGSAATSGLPFERVAQALRDRISSGRLRPGDRVPSTRALVREFGIASATAARALSALRDEGWIQTVPRSGSIVADRPPVSRGAAHSGIDVGRTTVIEEAIQIADREGIAAVTVRRLAFELGVPTVHIGSLLRGRDELTHEMISAVISRVPLPPSTGSWRTRLTACAMRQWAMYRQHPWLAQVLSLTRPQPIPDLIALGEFELAALESVETDPIARFDIYIAYAAYVRGMAIDLSAEYLAQTDTGVDADTWTKYDYSLGRAFEQSAGPALRSLGDYPYDVDRIFGRGLERLLDGFEYRARE